MKKTSNILLTAILFVALGFGITAEAKSETSMMQDLPCWRKKGNPMTGAGFLHCPRFIFQLGCDYVDNYTPKAGTEAKCDYPI